MNNSLSQRDTVAVPGSSHTMTSMGDVSLSIHEAASDIEDIWRELESRAPCSIYQKYDWVHTWVDCVAQPARITPKFVVGTIEGKTVFILPLGKLKRGPFSVATWLGDSHANFHLGLYEEDFLNSVKPTEFRNLILHIIGQIGAVDILELCCQPVVWQGKTNPFTYLKWQESHNHAYALQLDSDFDLVLNQRNGAKKRKKFRHQTNLAEKHGGARLLRAKTEEQIDEFLKTALTQISARFDQAGIWNRFDDAGVSEFLGRTAKLSLNSNQPSLIIYALEIGGSIRAVFAGGIHNNHFSGCFISHADDELRSISPGDMLIYLVIKECCEAGLDVFDLGRGEERYKTSWCDATIPMLETMIPFTVKGRAYGSYETTKLLSKRLIRNNKNLWNLAKKVRSRFYGLI